MDLRLFQNTQDILNITLAIGFIIIVIFLSLALLYLTIVLKDINHITQTTKYTVDQISNYVMKPVSIANKLIMNIKPLIELLEKKLEEKKSKKQKKRS